MQRKTIIIFLIFSLNFIFINAQFTTEGNIFENNSTSEIFFPFGTYDNYSTYDSYSNSRAPFAGNIATGQATDINGNQVTVNISYSYEYNWEILSAEITIIYYYNGIYEKIEKKVWFNSSEYWDPDSAVEEIMQNIANQIAQEEASKVELIPLDLNLDILIFLSLLSVCYSIILRKRKFLS